MKKSTMFEMVNRNYEKGLWGVSLVRMAVKKGYITKDEFTEITSEEY